MTGLEAAEMRFIRGVTGYTRLDKTRSEDTRRETQIQTKLEQPPWKNGQHQTAETRPQLQTSRKKRSWTPQETMAMRRCRNGSNDLIYGWRWWWWIRHNEFAVNILEGTMFGKKKVGRPRLQYLKQVARNTAADRHITMERVARNSSRWKAANQSKDWRIRRRIWNVN